MKRIQNRAITKGTKNTSTNCLTRNGYGEYSGRSSLRLRKYVTAILLMCFFALTPWPAFSQSIPQQVRISSSPNPVGSGARALGMGGAFIAIADDATAASWNPAGLTQLRKPECSFALSWFSRRDDFSSSSHPEASGLQKDLTYSLNYLSIALPFKLFKRNMIVSLNYQRLYEFERDIEIDFISSSRNPATLSLTRSKQDIDFRQQGSLKTLSPAWAIQVTPAFSFGITANIWTDNLFWSNGWENDTVVKGTIGRPGHAKTRFVSTDRDRYYGFSGFNMHIGFLWHISRFVSIGGVVKTPFTADMQQERVVTTTIKTPRGRVSTGRLRVDEDVELDMPLSYGLGAAFRISDTCTVSLDIYKTEWSHFILEDGDGNRMSPITGKPSHKSHVKSTCQVRFGFEYLFVFEKTIVPLRLGLFYDPEPSSGNPDDFWGFSLGSGLSIGKFVLDAAYRFRMGRDVEGEVIGIPSTDADVEQHLVMTSLIYYF